MKMCMSVVWPRFMLLVKNYAVELFFLTNGQKKGHLENQQLMFLIYIGIKQSLWHTTLG